MKDTALWNTFENGANPVPGGVILGDSAYACRSWLIPPFPGDVADAKLRFNRSHKKTRSLIERSIGILKCRFYSLMYGLRVRDMIHASKLIRCAVILHNICIRMNDDGEDFLIEEEFEEGIDVPPASLENGNQQQRRQELLQFFN